ncbi:MAG: phage tail tube protein [Hyphomonadaceae bacterium]
MSSNALESQGMTIARGDGGSPEAFTTIPEVRSISGPDGSANEIDVTDLSSSAKEFRMGLQDEGNITLDMMFIPGNTVHAGLRSDRANRTLRNFRLTFTDSPATVWSFAAYVQGLSVSNEVDSTTNASVTLRISGSITES